MRTLEGKLISLIFDGETLKLEEKYMGQAKENGWLGVRSEIVRTLYNNYLKTMLGETGERQK